MKILLVSMPSIHVKRWVENIDLEQHEVYWFDILNRGSFTLNKDVVDIINWQKRKINYINGEYFLSKKMPFLYNKIEKYLKTTIDEALSLILIDKQIDIVHSFEMQDCSYPLVKVMNKFPNIKWIYSCWGTDLFYFSNFSNHLSKIQAVLNRVDVLHTDCQRDYNIALKLGFKNKHAGVIPGGGGYHIENFKNYRKPLHQRKIILIKGYEHLFGRGLNVIKAIELIIDQLKDYELVVYATHQTIEEYIKLKKLPIKFYGRHNLLQHQVLELLGNSLIHIGNSVSDGCSNTLLEAVIMGAFPIQSNPGNVGEEIITNEMNGLLINNPEDSLAIKEVILNAIHNFQMLEKAYDYNINILSEKLDYDQFNSKINNLYC